MADRLVLLVTVALVALLLASANPAQGRVAPGESVSPPSMSLGSSDTGAVVAAGPVVHAPMSSGVSAVLSANGVSATAVSLLIQFTSRNCDPTGSLQESTSSSGPWTTLGTGGFRANVSLAFAPPGDASPNSTTDWRLVGNGTGSCSLALTSNVVSVRLSAPPTISVSQVSEDSATLTWNDPAHYGGDLGGGITLTELAGPDPGRVPINGNACSTFSRTFCSMTGLVPGTHYSFGVQAQSSTVNGSGCCVLGMVNSTYVQFTTTAPGFVTSTTFLIIVVVGIVGAIAIVVPLVVCWRRPPRNSTPLPTPESLPLPPAGP
jgi:hypothetical protein